jgi:hypothetical protein
MSSGDIDEKSDEKTYRTLLAQRPDMLKFVELPREVNRFYDIPYLAGVSRNATILFLDQLMPVRIVVGKLTIDPAMILVYHEFIEWWCMLNIPNIKYEAAHHIANAGERHHCERLLKMPNAWVEWNKSLDKWVKAAEQKPIWRAPSNLALYPYKGTKFERKLERFQH